MKRLLLLFAIFICLLPLSAGKAESEEFDSDTLFRLQLRLCDLGYLLSYPTGVYDDATALALAQYLSSTPGAAAEDVHQISAPAVPVSSPTSDIALTGIMGQPGVRIDWPYAMDMLTIGATYVLTHCESGAIAHVRYLGGDAHASITPVSNWDQATLSGLFGNASCMDKTPVTITLGSYRVAASLSGSPRQLADGTKNYFLYFFGSSSGVSGMPDVDHENTLERAIAH